MIFPYFLPEMLTDEGSGLSELQIIPGKNRQKKDTQVHYGAPVKLMLYDALNYSNQIEELANKHQIDKEKPADSGEFLSGIYREDRLVPVKTLIVYFNPKEWDGPRTLHDMLDMNGWTEE